MERTDLAAVEQLAGRLLAAVERGDLDATGPEVGALVALVESARVLQHATV